MAFIDIYFSLGSNLGDRRGNILRGLEGLDRELGTANRAISKFIESKPQGFKSRNDFINCCARYRVYMEEDPQGQCERILSLCKKLEKESGRETQPLFDESGNRIYRDRTLDIDILFFGKETINTRTLTVPHPRMKERPFVMIPLFEIARDNLKSSFPEIFG